MEISIKSRLIGRYARRQYYEYRNGVRLITPQMQQDIARICQEAGWTQPPLLRRLSGRLRVVNICFPQKAIPLQI